MWRISPSYSIQHQKRPFVNYIFTCIICEYFVTYLPHILLLNTFKTVPEQYLIFELYLQRSHYYLLFTFVLKKCSKKSKTNSEKKYGDCEQLLIVTIYGLETLRFDSNLIVQFDRTIRLEQSDWSV
uniref:Uncharacterized protein n=1 Tax=Cacopsylla melanoneura TaxID=428564 RepID=A0A8D8ZER8_9HEMI